MPGLSSRELVIQTSRTFRIFVSSTFSDLKEERNALQKNVFPRLRKLCMQHGCRFQAIDLRWGVREEASLDQQTMRICTEEIQRCQRVTPRPNFIMLLGDRYGWCPLPYEILTNEFEEIERRATDNEDKALLNRWYRCDDNAVPSVYCLQSRTGEFTDYANWEVVEHQLRAILLKATAGMKLTDEERIKYTASATEQEIVQGLNAPKSDEHVFCFFRTIKDLPQDAIAKDFIDLDEIGTLDEDATTQLHDLKENLRDHLPGNIYDYEAEWTARGLTKDHIDRLCEDVYNSLASVILKKIEQFEEIDPLDKEIADHSAFGKDRTKFFIGRAAILKTIGDYIERTDSHPLVIFGDGGSGKSALMAKAVEIIKDKQPKAEVITRFIGATPDSSDGRALLENLCRQISRCYGADESTIPMDYKELVKEFPKWLTLATVEKPLVLFLDALDQLSDTNNARNLIWLPNEIPEHVHIIVSTLPGECLSVLVKKLPAANIVELEPMRLEEGSALLDAWLKDAYRTLQNRQREEVLSKFRNNGLPLYLKLAFEEAHRWKSYTEKIELCPDVPGVIRDMFMRLSSDANHGRVMVSRSLGFLAATKNGLTEDELLDVLSNDEAVFQDFIKRAYHKPPEKRLPVIVWSRLYFDLEPYLTERSADGTSLLTFYHRQFGEVVTEEFLADETKRKRHEGLARYFGFQPLWIEKAGKNTANLRKVSELPYQQTCGEMWDEIEQTLCDLHFIEAKCAGGMTYDLINDYKDALKALPESALRVYMDFLSPRATFLTEYTHFLTCEVASELPSSRFTSSQIAKAHHRLRELNIPWLEKVRGDTTFGSWLTEPTVAIAFSQDGSVVLTGDSRDKVLVWDRVNWQLRAIHSFPLSGSIMRLYVFDDNEHYLVVPDYGEMRIVSLETGMTVETFGDLWDADAAYVAGNTLLVVNRCPYKEGDGEWLWSINAKKPSKLQSDEPPDRLPYWAGLNGVGIARDQGIFDLATGQRIGTLGLQSVPAEYEWREHIFHSITPYALVAWDTAIHIGRTLTVHSLPSGEIVEKYDLDEVATKPYGYRYGARVTIGHRRKLVLVWCNGGNVLQVVDLSKHQSEIIRFDMHIHAVELDPIETMIYVCLADDTLAFHARRHALRIFCSETLQELQGPSCLPSVSSELLLSEGGSFALSEKRKMFDTETGNIIAEIGEPYEIWTNPRGGDPFSGFLRDRGWLVRYGVDGAVRKIIDCNEKPTKFRLSADLKVLALAYGDHYHGSSVIIVRDHEACKYIIDESFGDGLSVDLSPTGYWFLAVCNHTSHIGLTPSGHSIYLLNTIDGRAVRSQDQIVDFINMAIFVPNSQFVAVAFADGTIQLREMQTLQVRWSNRIHHGNIRKIAASPNAALLATIGMDQRLIVTSVSLGEVITAKPFGFVPRDCEFTTVRDLVLAAPGDRFFKYRIHVGAMDTTRSVEGSGRNSR